VFIIKCVCQCVITHSSVTKFKFQVVIIVVIMIVSALIPSGSELKLFGVDWQKKCVYLGVLSSHIVFKLAAACLVDLAG
jgi:hypothetical protein